MAAKSDLELRKRPELPRASRTVDVILEAAASLLETEGSRAMITNAVAARAGVSIGCLYQYFPNRDALAATLIEREERALNTAIASAERQPGRERALGLLISAGVADHMRRPGLARALAIEERRLGLGGRSQRLAAAFETVLKLAPARPRASAEAHDMLAMLAALCDAAAMRGETSAEAVEGRVRSALFGYLGRL